MHRIETIYHVVRPIDNFKVFFALSFVNAGNVQAYNQMLKVTFEAAKSADPGILVVRGKSNFGNAFDDAPDLSTVLTERNREGFIDSLLKSLDSGGEYYDLFAINFNDHHSGLEHITKWLSSEMLQRGFAKPFLVADARTTLYPRDNSEDNAILPPRYPSDFMQVMDDPSHPDYQSSKKILQADEVQHPTQLLKSGFHCSRASMSD